LPSGNPLLVVDEIDVAFGPRRHRSEVIRSASFELEAGEIVALIGESGSGKSTLARAILGLVDVSRGSIRVDGEEVTGFSTAQWRTFRRKGAAQYVFQDSLRSLDGDMLIFDSIAESLRIRGGMSKPQVRETVNRYADRVRLDQALLSRYPSELSGGQRQRAAIARALVCEPRLIILDEPVSALDAATRVQVLNSLVELRSDTVGIMYISHDLGSVAGIADRTEVLYRGQIVESGPTAEIVRNPRHPYTRLLVGSAPTLSGT
jgi:ABC-type glutathione transport system ATPase component